MDDISFARHLHASEFLIRRASLRPALWRRVLARMERVLPGVRCSILSEPRGSKAPPGGVRLTSRGMVGLLEGSGLAELDDEVDEMPAGLVPLPVTAGRGAPAGLALVLHRCDRRLWSLAMEGDPAFGEESAARATAMALWLRPLLVGSFRLRHAISLGEAPLRRDVDSAWDGLSRPTLLLDRDRRVEAANVAAEDALSSRALFQPPGGEPRLRFRARASEDRFEEALHRLLIDGEGRIAFKVPDGAGRSALITLRAPGECFVTKTAGEGIPPPARVLVTLSRPA